MKDIEKAIVKSFLFALTQQEKPLPKEIQSRLNQLADSFEKNIQALRDLALQTPDLASPYRQSYDWLLQQSAQRGMGLDFLPAENPGERENLEIENITRDPGKEIDRLEKIIQQIESKLDKTSKILANNNSVNSAKNELL